VFGLPCQTANLWRIKILAQWCRSRHDEPPGFAMLNLTRLHLGIAHESQFQGLGITGAMLILRCRFARSNATSIPILRRGGAIRRRVFARTAGLFGQPFAFCWVSDATSLRAFRRSAAVPVNPSGVVSMYVRNTAAT